MPAGKMYKYTKKSNKLSETQAKQVKAITRKIVRGRSQKKVFGWQQENIELFHNKPYYVASFLKCKQGVADPNNLTNQEARIGDEILLRQANIRLWLSNKADRPNCMYKCIMFWYDSSLTLSDALCFFTQTNKMLDRPNNENISVIDEKTVFSRENYATTEKEHSYLCTLNGNWKGHKVIYDEGGFVPKKRDIGILVVAYDAYGTLQTDNIASFAYNAKIVFNNPL